MHSGPSPSAEAPGTREEARGSYRWLPACVSVLGLLLTAHAVAESLRSTTRLDQIRREQALNAVVAAMRTRLEATTASLQGLAGHFDASAAITAAEFHRYLERIRQQTDAIDIGQPIAWIRRQPGAVQQLALIDPQDIPRQQAVALTSMLSHPAAGQGMAQARDTARPMLSPPIAAGVASQASRGQVLLLLLPLYGQGQDPGSVAARREGLRGWLLMPLRPDELINGAIRVSEFQLNEPVDVQLFAGQPPGPGNLIHDSTGGQPPVLFSPDDQRGIAILGVRWTLATQLPWLEQRRTHPWIGTLGSGLLLTGLLTALSHRLIRQNHRMQEALDVADRAHAQEASARGELRLSTEALRQIEEGIAITDLEGRLLKVNDAFCRLVGSRREDLLSDGEHLLEGRRGDKGDGQKIWSTVIERGSWQGEIWIQRSDGAASPAWLNVQTLHNDEGVPSQCLGTLSDLSRLQEKDDRLNHLGYHDQLTDLPNMRKLRLDLEAAMGPGSAGLQIFWLDLDGFKRINDSFGHEQGDRVIHATAERLRQSLEPGDLLARIGNDEFLLVLQKGDGGRSVQARARGLIQVVHQPLTMGEGLTLEMNACCGISLYPDHGHEPGDLLQFAATALTEAKQIAPGTVRAYEPRMTRASQHRLRLESALQHGIESGELSVMFQPQTDARGQLRGAECLLRWDSARLGVIPPSAFIPIAEASGLIHRIGPWVLETTCRQLRQWREQGLEVPRLAVNVSTLQFQEPSLDLPELMASLLATHGLRGDQIELEITESSLLLDFSALEQMQRLAAMGIPIAVDDFGTGFSSLSVLLRFPISKIKIDRSFITCFDRREFSRAIVKSTLAMARELGLATLAEGPERAEEVRLLHAYGCDLFQGYFFSPPLTLEAFTALLASPDRLLPRLQGPALHGDGSTSTLQK